MSRRRRQPLEGGGARPTEAGPDPGRSQPGRSADVPAQAPAVPPAAARRGYFSRGTSVRDCDREQRHAVDLRARAVLAPRQAVDQDAADRCARLVRRAGTTPGPSCPRRAAPSRAAAAWHRRPRDRTGSDRPGSGAARGRSVVEHEQRAAAFVGVLEFVELDRKLPVGGGQWRRGEHRPRATPSAAVLLEAGQCGRIVASDDLSGLLGRSASLYRLESCRGR